MTKRKITILASILVIITGVGSLTYAGFKSGLLKISASEEGSSKTESSAIEKPEYAKGQFIIKFKEGKTKNLQSSVKSTFPIKSFKPVFSSDKISPAEAKAGSDLSRYYKMEFDLSKAVIYQDTKSTQNASAQDKIADLDWKMHQSVIESLSSDPDIESVSLNYKRKANWEPNDPYYSTGYDFGTGYDAMWGLKNISMNAAWDQSRGRDVTVAVVDSGVDYNHEDLAANIYKDSSGKIIGKNFVTASWYDPPIADDYMDTCGHGTHVAGTIAAVGNNGIGIIGVAPEAKIMPVRVLNEYGSGWDEWVADGIIYAADNGAKVINLSLGGPGESFLLKDAISYAKNRGVITVTAAGNGNANSLGYYPAASPDVITVGAMDPYQKRASFSNFGPKIDVTAPGVDIISAIPEGSYIATHIDPNKLINGKYARLDGTSMAAPHVAGAVALEIAKNPTWKPEDIDNAVIHSARDLGIDGKDDEFGYGLIGPSQSLASNDPLQIPQAQITTNSLINKTDFDIHGTAGGADFTGYTLEYKKIDLTNYNLGAYTKLSNSSQSVNDGTLGKILANKFNDGQYYLRVSSKNSSNITNYANVRFAFAKNQITGFPILSPYVNGDIDPIITKLDGKNDVVLATTYNAVETYDQNGKKLWSAAVCESWCSVGRKPIISDLDKDGKQEIVILRQGLVPENVMVFDYQGKLKWQYNLDQYLDEPFEPKIFTSGDYNSDGKNEIVIGERSSDHALKVVMLGSSGKLLKRRELLGPPTSDWIDHYGLAVASGDINSNGKQEIIVSYVTRDFSAHPEKDTYYIDVLDQNLKTLWEIKNAGNFEANDCSMLLSRSKDGQPALIYMTDLQVANSWQSEKNFIYIINPKGKIIDQKALGTTWTSHYIIPFTGNVTLTIQVPDPNYKYMFNVNYSIQVLSSTLEKIIHWPYNNRNISGWLAADLDNDNTIEVLARDGKSIRIIKDGKLLPIKLPFEGYSQNGIFATLTQAQIKFLSQVGQNRYEYEYPTVLGIYGWNFEGNYSQKSLIYPMHGHDLQNTNSIL